MRIAIGADHRGSVARDELVDLLRQLGHEVENVGAVTGQIVDYPDIAALVAGKVSRSEADRGILIARTGHGMCIVANKFPGVRAAVCLDEVTVEISRRDLDLNVLCLSAGLLSGPVIEQFVRIWLEAPFDGGRHARRIEKISRLEKSLLRPQQP
jgi:ribose 5-phosphate isomerase B